MAVLCVGKGMQALCKTVTGFQVCAKVCLGGIGFIIGVLAVREQIVTHGIILNVGDVTKVVALELLE